MATIRPKKPCAWIGCREYQEKDRFCAKHYEMWQERLKQMRQQRDQERLSSHKRGYTHRWRKVSKSYLISHPLCAECKRQGRLTPATEVDHIVAHKGDKKLFWDHSNWQPLCHECHSRKTAKENGGFGHQTPRGGLKNQ